MKQKVNQLLFLLFQMTLQIEKITEIKQLLSYPKIQRKIYQYHFQKWIKEVLKQKGRICLINFQKKKKYIKK